jgi:ribosome-binding factor A
MKKNSIKNIRINEEVLRALTDIIRNNVKDPRVDPMRTSVTDVEVAPDLKTCKIYISILGDDDQKKNTMTGLKSSGGFIRHELAEKVNLRNTPELTFIEDDSIEYGVRMSKLIDEVTARDRANEKEDGHDE